MPDSLYFILGLIQRNNPAVVSIEDLTGEHGATLRLWQRLGFLSREPEPHPTPSCPFCKEGVPIQLSRQLLCSECHGTIAKPHLWRWRVQLEKIITWLAKEFVIEGAMQRIEGEFWQLGCKRIGNERYEVFFAQNDILSKQARRRLLAFRSAILLQPMPAARHIDGFQGIYGSLLELLQQGDRSFATPTLEWLLERDRAVGFDQSTGRLKVGKQSLGELPVGSKEFYLMLHLSQHLDRYVSYRHLKHFVVHATGSSDETDEATFCHKLKSRIKKRILDIDRFLVTSNKGDGYRLQALVEPW